jgi:putative ABC transport system permease protein
MLSREFVVLVAVSFGLAVPLGWYLMNGWLSGFAYRIPLSWWIFALAGGLAGIIALLTVSFQSVKAGPCQPGEVAAVGIRITIYGIVGIRGGTG